MNENIVVGFPVIKKLGIALDSKKCTLHYNKKYHILPYVWRKQRFRSACDYTLDPFQPRTIKLLHEVPKKQPILSINNGWHDKAAGKVMYITNMIDFPIVIEKNEIVAMLGVDENIDQPESDILKK